MLPKPDIKPVIAWGVLAALLTVIFVGMCPRWEVIHVPTQPLQSRRLTLSEQIGIVAHELLELPALFPTTIGSFWMREYLGFGPGGTEQNVRTVGALVWGLGLGSAFLSGYRLCRRFSYALLVATALMCLLTLPFMFVNTRNH